jgi:hypothetical protein
MICGGEKRTGVRSGVPAAADRRRDRREISLRELSQRPHEATGTETPFSVPVISFSCALRRIAGSGERPARSSRCWTKIQVKDTPGMDCGFFVRSHQAGEAIRPGKPLCFIIRQ